MVSFSLGLVFTIGVICQVVFALVALMFWQEYLRFPDEGWQRVATLTGLWFASAAGLAIFSLAALPQKCQLSKRPFVIAISILIGGAAVAAAGIATPSKQFDQPLDTEEAVRLRIEHLLRRKAYSLRSFMRVAELSEQVRNVRIDGPGIAFEPPNARYVTFDLDTGCVKTIQVTAFLNSVDGDALSTSNWQNCAR